MHKLLITAFLSGLLAFTALGADVTGRWTAQVQGRGGQARETTFTFRVEGDRLTGTVSTPRGELPIADGRIEGDQISFHQIMEFNGNSMKLTYKGTVSGGEIRFTRMREGGKGRTQEFIAKRVP